MNEARLDAVIDIARRAGEAIMRHYPGTTAAERKADGSPVTAADHAAEAVIIAGLETLDPTTRIVSEEQAVHGVAPAVADQPFWCVDPLDGTKEFIARNGEFVVCIARIDRGVPVLGVLHAPALDLTFAAAGAGTAVRIDRAGRRQPIAVRAIPESGRIALDSRSHRDGAELDRWFAEHRVTERRHMGSAIKFGLVAEGAADFYVRFGPTHEWDTAAGQAVLEGAGGSVTGFDGARLRYGKPGFKNPGFIAAGATG